MFHCLQSSHALQHISAANRFVRTLTLAMLVATSLSSTVASNFSLDQSKGGSMPSMPDTVEMEALQHKIWGEFLFPQPDSAFHLAAGLFLQAKQVGNKKYMAQALRIQGIAKYLRGDLDEALNCYERGFTIEKERADTLGMASSMRNMAMIYKDRGLLPMAMEYCTKSLNFFESKHSDKDIAAALNQIGSILEAQDDLPRALEHYKRSLTLATKVNDHELQMATLQNIGSLLITQGKFADALAYADSALLILEPGKNDRGQAYALLTKGLALKGLGRYDEAIESEQKSLHLREAMGDNRGMARCLLNLSDAHLAKGDRPKAVELGKHALTLAQKVGEVQGIANAATALYVAYKAMGRASEALAMHELAGQMEDSLRTEENQQGVIEKRMQYDFGKKESDTKAAFERQRAGERLELERTRSQRLLFLLAGTFVILLSALLLNRNRVMRRLQIAQVRTRLSRDLHDDIGATLSSINILSTVAQRKAEAGDDAGAAASLTGISERTQRLMRNMSDIVWSVDPDRDSMEELLVRMREFGAAVLEPKDINYRVECRGELQTTLPPAVRSNLYLLFKEAVNNAAKHAEASEVTVCLEHEPSRLRLTIRDNGKGMDLHAQGNDKPTGNGQRNMRARATEMKAELHVDSARGQGTTVRLVVPL